MLKQPILGVEFNFCHISGESEMFSRMLLIVGCFLLSFTSWAGAETWPQRIGQAMVWQVAGSYEDVRSDLADAIESRGMVISYISHAKAMLDRTGKDLGYTDSVYPTGAEIFLFCKADISQKLVRVNPHHVVLCPYAIAVYDVAGEPGKVYLSYRVAPEGTPEYKPVEQLLRQLIESIVENY
ncbi:MAG TPA: DUF302 domain-containing protein [Piscirickettsiaceae bacterium]|nr:DUF302 domain-containing protein [Piscirickettsiaceae bacterium]